jgi:hypothetical protein
VAKIALSQAVALVRKELLDALTAPNASGLRFPVGQITLSLQIGLTTSATGSAGMDLWVLELGAEGSYAKETVQTVSIVLEPPVTAEGEGIKIASRSEVLPN